MYKLALLTIDELWLKGRNQHIYRSIMRDNIYAALSRSKNKQAQVKRINERFIVEDTQQLHQETIEQLAMLPGISFLSPAIKTENDYDLIKQAVIEHLKDKQNDFNTFAVRSRRTFKKFKPDSLTMEREIGGLILEKYPHLKVNLSNPETTVSIRVLNNGAYIYIKKIPGPGGLPVASSGRGLALLSGGFDSPVAAWLMMKRGMALDFAFFHAAPYVSKEARDKVESLAVTLNRYQNNGRFYVIPFGGLQNKLNGIIKPAYRTLMFRHFMLQAATLLAHKTQASALITGDSLGQVSSQTLTNLSMLEYSTEMLIIRPLIGTNKREIIDLSRTIGTHDISAVPQDDACTMFAPKSPVIHAEKEYWQNFISSHKYTDQLKELVDTSEEVKLP